jgi:hypothetical protein
LLAVAAGHHDVEGARRAYTQARRWSDLAGNRIVPTFAPLFLAAASPEDKPLDALSLELRPDRTRPSRSSRPSADA